MTMIIMKMLIGLMLIVIIISMLYMIGRIAMPCIDPESRREPVHVIVTMLAGVLVLAAIGIIMMVGVMAWHLGEVVSWYWLQ